MHMRIDESGHEVARREGGVGGQLRDRRNSAVFDAKLSGEDPTLVDIDELISEFQHEPESNGSRPCLASPCLA